MTVIPRRVPIYHITHVDNLPSILEQGGLLPDQRMIDRGGPSATIGMSRIKERRLGLSVKCHPGDYVGEYVPFYFCPRSIMLFLMHCRNPELAYRGGQGPIVHLEADMQEAVAWAEAQGHRWAFTLSNAGAFYAEFHKRLEDLSQVDWSAVRSQDFRDQQVKERKQAEFLLREFFPWHLVQRIGVHSPSVQMMVQRALPGGQSRPVVEVRQDWYY
jgi:ssDNA thymidine ADP-ribosyltransferase, DarT